jgi:site-specific recombinase XerD
METANVYRLNRDPMSANQPAPSASVAERAPKPKLLDQVRHVIRTRHYSYMTEKAYVGWIKRFIFFHNKRHPAEMAEAEIARFLSSLASDSHVAASTQNQALNALLFLYHEVLGKKIGYIAGVVRAKRPSRLPVVLTRQEVKTVLSLLCGTDWIMATLFTEPVYV